MPKLSLDTKLVEQLADLMSDKNLTEVEYADGNVSIRVSRAAATTIVAQPMATPEAAGGEQSADRPGTVPSPMVGTAYLSSQPGTPPFVKAGDKVQEGQTILIIEAMKVMNPIPAPGSGTITAIFVADGEPVEFGQPLVIIE